MTSVKANPEACGVSLLIASEKAKVLSSSNLGKNIRSLHRCSVVLYLARGWHTLRRMGYLTFALQ